MDVVGEWVGGWVAPTPHSDPNSVGGKKGRGGGASLSFFSSPPSHPPTQPPRPTHPHVPCARRACCCCCWWPWPGRAGPGGGRGKRSGACLLLICCGCVWCDGGKGDEWSVDKDVRTCPCRHHFGGGVVGVRGVRVCVVVCVWVSHGAGGGGRRLCPHRVGMAQRTKLWGRGDRPFSFPRPRAEHGWREKVSKGRRCCWARHGGEKGRAGACVKSSLIALLCLRCRRRFLRRPQTTRTHDAATRQRSQAEARPRPRGRLGLWP